MFMSMDSFVATRGQLSYQRRQERRKAQADAAPAATIAEQPDPCSVVPIAEHLETDDVAEKAAAEIIAEEAIDENVSEKTIAESEADKATDGEVMQENQLKKSETEQVLEYECCLCQFKSKWKTGLSVHIAKMHSQIEQLDGNAEILTDEGFDGKYLSTKHYWAKGYLGGGYQTYIDALEVVDDIDLSEEGRHQEKARILEARKDALGENYKYFPPWS